MIVMYKTLAYAVYLILLASIYDMFGGDIYCLSVPPWESLAHHLALASLGGALYAGYHSAFTGTFTNRTILGAVHVAWLYTLLIVPIEILWHYQGAC